MRDIEIEQPVRARWRQSMAMRRTSSMSSSRAWGARAT